MDKHDKHNKPGKSRGKAGAKATPVEAPVAETVEKGKGDWPGKQQDSNKSR